MARKVIWAAVAWNDLDNAASFIAKDSPYYAATFILEARDAARSLSTMAGRGRMVPEFRDPHMRELFVRNYRLIYQMTSHQAVILGFIHGSRDLWRLWAREHRQR